MLASGLLVVLIAKRSNIRPTGSPCIRPRGAEQRAVVDLRHEPNGCALAQRPGDLCRSRALRAPQDQGEYRGRLLWVTFLGEARKVTRRQAKPGRGKQATSFNRAPHPSPLPREERSQAPAATERKPTAAATASLLHPSAARLCHRRSASWSSRLCRPFARGDRRRRPSWTGCPALAR